MSKNEIEVRDSFLVLTRTFIDVGQAAADQLDKVKEALRRDACPKKFNCERVGDNQFRVKIIVETKIFWLYYERQPLRGLIELREICEESLVIQLAKLAVEMWKFYPRG
jgi:hypothetical protein